MLVDSRLSRLEKTVLLLDFNLIVGLGSSLVRWPGLWVVWSGGRSVINEKVVPAI